jgi:hypothetical protein
MQKLFENIPEQFTGKSMYLLFSHQLTPDQQQSAENSFGVNRFINPPEWVQTIWSQIPPDAERLEQILLPVKTWLEKHAIKEDMVLIQGDFGATFLMVNHAISLELVPVYATTERQAKEKKMPDGRIKMFHVFNFRRFRMYGK